MKVSEIFYSIQGEGINVGKPAVFVRLQECNLRCSFCDSKYTWNSKEGREMSKDEVVKEIKKFKCNHVVWTGGEPSLQISEIEDIMLFKLFDYTCEIETNGTIYFFPDPFDLVTISPKRGHVNYRVLKKFSNENNTLFKFVIADRGDLRYWLRAIKRLKLSKNRCMFMPEGKDEKTLRERSLWLVEKCKEHNIRFSPRLHIILYGNVRGR